MKDTDVLFQRKNGTVLILAKYPWKVYGLFGIPRIEAGHGWPTVRDYEYADLLLKDAYPPWEALCRDGPAPVPGVAYPMPETANQERRGIPRVWDADVRVSEPEAGTRPPLPEGFEWISAAAITRTTKRAGRASPASEPGDVCAEERILKTQLPKLAHGNSSLDDICYIAVRRQ